MSKNYKISHQVTPTNQILLRKAIYRGDKEAVKRLLDKDSDINIQPSLLIKVVEDGQKEIVDMFIKNHFDININVREGLYYITPLMQAVKHNKLEVVTLFLNAEAKVNAQDSFGYTALMQATVYCYRYPRVNPWFLGYAITTEGSVDLNPVCLGVQHNV